MCKLCHATLSNRTYALRTPGELDFEAAECKRCGLFQVVYDWSRQEPLKFTEDADELLQEELWGAEREVLATKIKAATFAQRLASDGLLRGARVLEIGCGRGFFLHHCQALGALTATGQEFRNADIAYARQVLGIDDIRPVETTRTDIWPDDEFDLVCSFDVVEHVHDLKTFFQQCFRVVRDGGVVIHATPGYDSPPHRLGRFLGRHSPTERTSLLAGILCNLDPQIPEQGGGHVSILGVRQLKWLEKVYAVKIEKAYYISSYSYSNEHYATYIPQLRKLPPSVGAVIFAVLRATIKNKLVFYLRARG